ncbi:hypothetical protein EVS84_02725 [Pseudomonas koreensis]|uniref:Delta-60 repeat domain-containing protein n=2 Tax=Pseudomonas TaxID=286 RepID=A0A4Q4L9T5_9PSED|nr:MULTISPECIES: hypothetical protein [Pseudomonas]MDM8190317.1 hypothetical protein [Pseudomonas fluorescens]MDP8571562.1 hypothetical protein [Pseudomonas iranensis]RYM44678.1 hypothetical protein EVS84_02725 [Pseudomonas koreensis]
MDVAANISPGNFDPTFGNQGVAIPEKPPYVSGNLVLRGLMVDKSGRTYIAGSVGQSTGNAYYLIRLDINGVHDTQFGQNGYVTGQFEDGEGSHSFAKEIVEQDDGKLLLIGNFFQANLKRAIGVVRLDVAGNLDPAFNKTGKVAVYLSDDGAAHQTHQDLLNAANSKTAGQRSTVLPDGKIILHTTVGRAGNKVATAVIRLLPDGTRDIEFNEGEIAYVLHPDFTHTELYDLLAKQDGTYVLAGCVRSNHPYRAVLNRLTATGKIDESFAVDGFEVIDPVENPLNVNVLKVIGQTNKRLLSVGYTERAHHGVLISREADGKPNIQFNAGKPLLSRLQGIDTLWLDASIQSSGHILVAGLSRLSSGFNYVIARFIDDGKLDTGFADGKGWRVFDMERGIWWGAAIAEGKMTFLGQRQVDGQRVQCVGRGLIE